MSKENEDENTEPTDTGNVEVAAGVFQSQEDVDTNNAVDQFREDKFIADVELEDSVNAQFEAINEKHLHDSLNGLI